MRSKSPVRVTTTTVRHNTRSHDADQSEMIKTILLGATVGGVLLFAWGFVANTFFPWGVPTSNVVVEMTPNTLDGAFCVACALRRALALLCLLCDIVCVTRPKLARGVSLGRRPFLSAKVVR